MSIVRASAHVPYVAIESRAAPLAQGELVHLSFDEWKLLDGSFPFADRAYERSRPLFIRVDLDFGTDDSLRDAVETMEEVTRRVHEAIMLVTAARTPSPNLSIAYHVDVASGIFATRVGPFGREVLLYPGDWRLVLDREELDRVRTWAAFLDEHRELAELPELAAGLATLERTSRPELTRLSSLVHEIGALEALVMPEARTQLTATFARRVAALLAQSKADLRPIHKWARRWYQARSEVLHGGGLEAAIADVGLDENEFLFEARRGLVAGLGAALWKLSDRPEAGLEQLRTELDAAWAADGALARPGEGTS
jgi:hypothetical protein